MNDLTHLEYNPRDFGNGHPAPASQSQQAPPLRALWMRRLAAAFRHRTQPNLTGLPPSREAPPLFAFPLVEASAFYIPRPLSDLPPSLLLPVGLRLPVRITGMMNSLSRGFSRKNHTLRAWCESPRGRLRK